MGKGKKSKKNKASHANLNSSALVFYNPNDRTEPEEVPKLITPETFRTISENMLQSIAPHRNVLMTVGEYYIKDVNPAYVETSDSPTHMIIFCLRLIVTDRFHPIGVILIDKRVDQTEQLVEAWRTYLRDISILRLIVVGTISPASLIFYKILDELTMEKIPSLEDHTGPILYNSWPFTDIVHLYDYCNLLHETQEILFERNELCFISSMPSENRVLRLWTATWTDILLVMASQGIYCFYTTDDPSAPPIAIFFSEFLDFYEKAMKDGVVDTESREGTTRLMELFCPFTQLIASYKSSMRPYDLQVFYDNNEELRWLLASAKFKKLNIDIEFDSPEWLNKSPIPAEEVNTFENIHNEETNGKFSARSSDSIEIDKEQMDEIFDVIDNSFSDSERPLVNTPERPSVNDPDPHPVSVQDEKDPYDVFLRKVTFDNYDLFLKTTPGITIPQVEAIATLKNMGHEDIVHDHSYIKKKTFEKLIPSQATASRLERIVRDFFADTSKQEKKHVEVDKIVDESNEQSGAVDTTQTIIKTKKADNIDTVSNDPKLEKNTKSAIQSQQISDYTRTDLNNSKLNTCLTSGKELRVSVIKSESKNDNFLEKLPKITWICGTPTDNVRNTENELAFSAANIGLKEEIRRAQPKEMRGKKLKAKRIRNRQNEPRWASKFPHALYELLPERHNSACTHFSGSDDPTPTKINNSHTLSSGQESTLELSKPQNNFAMDIFPPDSRNTASNVSQNNTSETLLDLNERKIEVTLFKNIPKKSNLKLTKRNNFDNGFAKPLPKAKTLRFDDNNDVVIDNNISSSKDSGQRRKEHKSISKTEIKFDPFHCEKKVSIGNIRQVENQNNRSENSSSQDSSSALTFGKKSNDLKSRQNIENQIQVSEIAGSSKCSNYDEQDANKDSQVSDTGSTDSLTELMSSRPDSKIPSKFVIPKIPRAKLKRSLKPSSSEASNSFRETKDLDSSIGGFTTLVTKSLFFSQSDKFECVDVWGINQNVESAARSNASLDTLHFLSDEIKTQHVNCNKGDENMLLKELTTDNSSEVSKEEDYSIAHSEGSHNSYFLQNPNTINESSNPVKPINVDNSSTTPDSSSEIRKNSIDYLTDCITQALFDNVLQKKSVELDLPSPQTADTVETQKASEDAFRRCTSQNTVSSHERKPEGYRNLLLENQTDQTKENVSSLSTSDELDSTGSESITKFFSNSTLHEDISKMFAEAENDEDLDLIESEISFSPGDGDSLADLEKNFLIGNANHSSVCMISEVDKENIIIPDLRHTSSSTRPTKAEQDTKARTEYQNNAESQRTSSLQSGLEAIFNNLRQISTIETTDQHLNVDNFLTENNVQKENERKKSELMPCCSFASCSSTCDHNPSDEIKIQTYLPHYTRFRESPRKDSSSSDGSTGRDIIPILSNSRQSFIDIVENPVTLEQSIAEEPLGDEAFSNQSNVAFNEHNQSLEDNTSIDKPQFENNEIEENIRGSRESVDYKEYRKSLEEALSRISNFDIIYRAGDNYRKLYSEMPDDFETLRLTTDWLCTFKGYIKLKDILLTRKVRHFQPSALSLEHLDCFIHLLKMGKFEETSIYQGQGYRFLDYKCAIDLVFNDVLMIKRNDDS